MGKRRIRPRTLVKVLLIVGVIGILLWINHRYLDFSPEYLRAWMLSFEEYAPFLFIIVFTLRSLVLFPSSILTIAGGIAFGPVWGTIYTAIGATLGGSLSFLISRQLGKEIVTKPWKGRFRTLEGQLTQHGFWYVLVLRLIPVLNFDLVSYVAGISKVRFGSYFYGTLIGIVPSTFIYNYLGASFVEGEWTDILIAGLLFIGMTLIPFLFKKHVPSTHEASDTDANYKL